MTVDFINLYVRCNCDCDDCNCVGAEQSFSVEEVADALDEKKMLRYLVSYESYLRVILEKEEEMSRQFLEMMDRDTIKKYMADTAHYYPNEETP